MTRLLVTGAEGGLGRVLVAAAHRRGTDVVGVDRDQGDLADAAFAATLVDDVAPDLVVHAAAWTDVDAAEEDEPGAHRVNAVAAGNVARACADAGVRLVHLSTDFVFGGPPPTDAVGRRRGWAPDDEPAPVQAYGRTKLAGEQQVLAAGGDAVVVRLSTLASPSRPGFVGAVAARARAGAALYAPVDRWASPTFTTDLAPALLELADETLTGIVHRANHGPDGASKHALAVAVVEALGSDAVVAARRGDEVEVGSARRPEWSVLDQGSAEDAGLARLPHWRDALPGFLADAGAP